jgi:hypothetical protein
MSFQTLLTFPSPLTLSNQYWCWISDRFNVERMAGEYVWIWIALFASIVLNIPVFLYVTGRLLVDANWPYVHVTFAKDSQLGSPNSRATLRLLMYALHVVFCCESY